MSSQATKRNSAIAFLITIVAAVLVLAVTGAFASPSVPEGDVAFVEDVEDGAITVEEYERSLEQVAARQGLEEVPEEGEQLEALRDAAISDLILTRWVRGEAADRGLEADEREIEQQLEEVVEQQFGGQREFNQFLEQARLSEEEARERIELTILSNKIQEEALPAEPDVEERDIELFYEQNPEQFTTPEQRDLRVIVNPEREEAEQALEQLQQDDSNRTWREVAEEHSTDEATQGRGGLLEGVTEAAAPAPEVGEQAFQAAEGELVGPFETDLGFYVLQVQEVTAEETTPLEEASESIRAQLGSIEQQQIAQSFETEFVQKWTSRTACADAYVVARCDNFSQPEAEDPAVPEGGAPVPSTRPIEPGEAGVIGRFGAAGRPQGPQGPEAEQPVGEELPIPVGPDGAPQIP